MASLVASLNPSNDGASEKNPANNEHPTGRFSFKFATAGHITRIIKELKNTRAEGVDNIPTDAWKKGVVFLACPIIRLCKITLSTGVFPDLFKQALVYPVHKGSGKDHREPGSYCPISTLPALCKIREIVVRDALYQYLDLRGVLPDSQFCFHPVMRDDLEDPERDVASRLKEMKSRESIQLLLDNYMFALFVMFTSLMSLL